MNDFNGFYEHERLKDIIGITVFAFFIAGIVLVIYGFWLKRHGKVVRGTRLVKIGLFTTFFALLASLCSLFLGN